MSKFVSGAGRWAVQYPAFGHPGFALMLHGACWLQVEGSEPLPLEAGDYVLLPATPAFRMGSDLKTMKHPTLRAAEGAPAAEVRHGPAGEAAATRMLGGYFLLDPTNAPLLLALLPPVVHIKPSDPGAERLAWIARAVADECTAERPGGEAILTRLVEIMLVEALRWLPARHGPDGQPPGLFAGLADARMAKALRRIHDDVARRWTIEELAQAVGMSRAAFAARFTQVLGVPPMEYALRWRMALAKDMIWHDGLALGEVAHAVGYQSASAFSAAFQRTVGVAPGSFARTARNTPAQARTI